MEHVKERTKGLPPNDSQGAHAYLAPVTVRAIEHWPEKGGINKGVQFRRVETNFYGSVRSVGQGSRHPGTIGLIYKRLVGQMFAKKLLGAMGEGELERWVTAVSSHPIRVGVAQEDSSAGEALPAIMQAYRRRDPNTVMRYGAKLAEIEWRQRTPGERFAGDRANMLGLDRPRMDRFSNRHDLTSKPA